MAIEMHNRNIPLVKPITLLNEHPVVIRYTGKQYEDFDTSSASRLFQDALKYLNFGKQQTDAVDYFMYEMPKNAVKAKGIESLASKYGPLEQLLINEVDAKEIICREIRHNIFRTEVSVIWELEPEQLVLTVTNNSVPSPYSLQRIERAFVKDPHEQPADHGQPFSLHGTEASGNGLGIVRTRYLAEQCGGTLTFSFDETKTAFSLILPSLFGGDIINP